MNRLRLGIAAVVLGALAARADMPAQYAPMPIEAPFALNERVFDLTPALERARAEGKLLFVYFGAKNCPYCKQYESFLDQHRDALVPVYGKHVVADIRTYIRGPDVYFKVGNRKYSFREFATIVGDSNSRTTYPRFWLVNADLRPARRLPQTSKPYGELQEHIRLVSRPS